MNRKSAAMLSMAVAAEAARQFDPLERLKSGYPPGKKGKPRPKIEKKNYVAKRKKKKSKRKKRR